MEKANWEQKVNEIITGYLSRGDGCFDAEMHAKLCGYSYEEQINERGGIHGGAIAGMFDTAFGVVANFVAGENEAATADMNVSFIRPVEYGEHPVITVYIVKKGRSIIRLRAEMFCKESGKLTAAAAGTWIPL